MKKRLLILILIAAMAAALCVPALAEDAGDAAQSAGEISESAADPPGETGSGEDDYDPFDAQELSSMILELFARKKIDPERIGVTYCYTPTGETCSVNGSAYFGGASLYKLTEMMGLARMVAAGEYDQEDMINGMTITYIEDRCLTYSDNNVGESILMWYQTQLGGMAGFRRLQREIAGVPEEELPADFYSTLNYSSDFTMGVLKELYAHPGKYPKITEYMLKANDQYVKIRLTQGYDVAHKYGGGEGTWNIAAIVYSPTPFLVSIMSHYAGGGAQTLNDIIQLLADYNDTLELRVEEHRAELERQAEEARRAAEEARLAEEERLRKEAEEAARLAAEAEEKARREAEEAARLAAEAEERARQEELAAREEAERLIREEKTASVRKTLGIAAALTAAAGAAALIIRSAAKKKAARRRAARRRAAAKRGAQGNRSEE